MIANFSLQTFARICLAMIALGVVLSASSSSAEARKIATKVFCKDCPFPHKISQNRWLMPNGHFEVQIDQEKISRKIVAVYVTLRDPDKGTILAVGRTQRKPTQRNITLQLIDRGGNRVNGQIYWVDFEKDVIQARFFCDGYCSIKEIIEEL